MSKNSCRAVALASLVLLLLAVSGAFSVGAAAQATLAARTPIGAAGGWQSESTEYHPSRLIVKFSDATVRGQAAEAVNRLGYSLEREVSFESTSLAPAGLRLGVVNIPDGVSLDAAMARLSAAPGVDYVQRDYKHYKDQVFTDAPVFPTDPMFDRMWGLHNEDVEYVDPEMDGTPVDDADIDAPEAWEVFTGDSETIVAIIDTGCYIYHPDLAPNIWVNPDEIAGNGIDDDNNGYVDDINGWDFFNIDNTVFDPTERDIYGYLNDEHGTHTSGTIGAVSNNAMGVAGINWNVKIIVLKFLGPDGGYTSDAILALNYAAQEGAKVISCSWGGGPYEQALKDAIEATNALVVCAAGNSGDNTDITPHYPSSYASENIISVGAFMQNDTPCEYPGWWSTCWGPVTVDLFAPGGYILSTIPPDPPPATPAEAYAFFWGTSMATPHVSGAAALLHSLQPSVPLYAGAPGWTPGMPTVKDAILNTVDVMPAYQGLSVTGGRLNLGQAIRALRGPRITTIEADPLFGPPPLEVTFRAEATSLETTIVDQWWDFGDGSDAVHEYDAVHTYEAQGDFTATFYVEDNEGTIASSSVLIRVFFPPEISVDPTFLESHLWWGESETKSVTVSNTGLGELDYTASVSLIGKADESGVHPLGHGGPDTFGYLWFDTDDPGMGSMDWVEISGIGTEVTLGDDTSVNVPLPFDFPFYGETKTSVNITSNGYLTFGTGSVAWTNSTIPNTASPNDIIAPFWDDLTLSSSGTCHYYATENSFIVQYTNVPRLSSGGPYTFQVLLTPQGAIMFNYLSMQGSRLNEATVGIENSTGTMGLQVAFDEPYVHDDLAVGFVPGWLMLDEPSGTVAPGSSGDLNLQFVADHLPKGTWLATVDIHSNDPNTPVVSVDTELHVKSIIPPTIVSASAEPWAGSAPLTVQFAAEAVDSDGEITLVEWDFGDASHVETGTFTPVHTYTADASYTAVVRVVDNDGFEATRDISVLVQDLPQAALDPPSFTQVIRAHRQRTEKLSVTNTGVAPLIFTAEAATSIPDSEGHLEPLASGGPDGFGYAWRDSDSPGGPVFDWVEISSIGTKLTTLTDDQTATIALPWDFPFYGEAYTSLNVNANGWLNFGTYPTTSTYVNSSIPNTSAPNSLLAIYWDDLYVAGGPDGAGVYYYHDTVNDSFVVQYNKAPRYRTNGQYTFQAVLYPDGTIVYQYLDMQFAPAYVAYGTIGIENASGTDGLQILHNTAGYVHNGLAVRIGTVPWLSVNPAGATLDPGETAQLDVVLDLSLIESGSLNGAIVIDTNDVRDPRKVVPVSVDVIPNAAPVITACGVTPVAAAPGSTFQFVAAANDPDGTIADMYWDFGDSTPKVHSLVADHVYSAAGVYTATFTAVDNDGYTASATVKVTVAEPASASWNPTQFMMHAGGGTVVSDILTLANAGPGTLLFGAGEMPSMVRALKRAVEPGDIKEPDALTAEGLGIYDSLPSPERSEWLPDDVGSVLTSFTCPPPIGAPWSIGVLLNTGELVIGDGAVDPTVDYVVTTDGSYTGTSWSADFGGSWAGDMAFDGTYIWQVNVGGDNAIHKIDPATGNHVGSISGSGWTAISQRGLAYNPNDDTFYVGGWNEDIVYKIMGETWGTPGQIIEQWSLPVSIAGLAYHPVADVLLVTGNSDPDMIYLVNASTHALLGQMPHPEGNAFANVGCELDAAGNLWVGSFPSNTMYLVETGLGPISAGSWLSWAPGDGSVPAGGSVEITVTADTTDLTPGVYTGKVVIATSDTENPLIVVPVTVTVAQAPTILAATAEPKIGEPPLEVEFHAEYVAGDVPVTGFGWDTGDGATLSELDATYTYMTPGLYTATFWVEDELGARAEASQEIDVRWMPRASVSPESIEVTLPFKGVHETEIIIGNIGGNTELTYSIKGADGPAPYTAMPVRRIGAVPATPDERDARGLFEPMPADDVARIAANVVPDGVGSVITSWTVPSAITLPWGLGLDSSTLWISDPQVVNNHLVALDGTHTGVVFDAAWAGSWNGDMAYDPNNNLMWQVNVGGNNGIYGLDPATGEVVSVITGSVWTATSQRGVAYDAEADVFYIGGWNEDIIYRVAGLSWPTPGAVLDGWTFGVGIAGLAWHPDGILWVASNAAPDMIYGLDLEAISVVYQFPHPFGGEFNGAGLTLASDGNLWVASMDNYTVYLVDTEMPISTWLEVDPAKGTLAEGATQTVAVTINAEHLGAPGDDVSKHIVIETNDPMNPRLYVDLTVHIEAGPTIESATATPAIGHPPLDVTFDAVVTAGAVPITDVWWEFGDGSEVVHSAAAQHTYADLGTYTATFHAVDENSVEVSQDIVIQVKWLPTLELTPDSFDEVVQLGEERQTVLHVANSGAAPLNFSFTTGPSFAESPEWLSFAAADHAKGDGMPEPRGYAGAGAGGPDEFGYIWMDSNQTHGPEFDWTEIRDVGTRLSMTDESLVSVGLPFAFPFYGTTYNNVMVCSNGYLTFQAGRSEWINAPIPDTAAPNALIALFWDDINPATAGSVYYYHDAENNQFIVEFEGVPLWGSTDTYTFQAVLKPNGDIIVQYLDMAGDVTGATVGIENGDGTDGLQVVYNAAYVEDGLAVAFSPVGRLLAVNPSSGRLLPGNGQDVVVTVGQPEAAAGRYNLNIYAAADDPFRPFATIPVAIKVNAPPSVAITAPVGGAELHGMTEILYTASDSDDAAEDLLIDIAWTRDGVEWNVLAEAAANTGSLMWNTIEVGEGGDCFLLRATAHDPSGASTQFITDAFTIVNLPPEAAFSYSRSGSTVVDEITFTDESTDDGTIVAWHWSFGDGSESTEQNPVHRYAVRGDYTVTLKVVDNGGLTDEATATLSVVNAAPTVTLIAPETGVVWTGSKKIKWEASDADGDELTVDLFYDYVDDEAAPQAIATGLTNTGTHTWDTSEVEKGGVYRVLVTVTDTSDATATDTSGNFTIVVLTRAIVAAPNPAMDAVTFYYALEEDSTLYVYDIAGRLVYRTELAASSHSHAWDLTSGGRPVANGIYIYLVTNGLETSEPARLVVSR
jgi:PKD repeat protein